MFVLTSMKSEPLPRPYITTGPFQCDCFSQENGLTLILKRDLGIVFQDCKMVAVAQNNGCNAEDMMSLKHRLHKHDIAVKLFPNQVKSKASVKEALNVTVDSDDKHKS